MYISKYVSIDTIYHTIKYKKTSQSHTTTYESSIDHNQYISIWIDFDVFVIFSSQLIWTFISILALYCYFV